MTSDRSARTCAAGRWSVWLLIASLWAPAAPAQEFEVDGASTQTNGGETIDGDDTLTITEAGSIRVSGFGARGVAATGGNNLILNSGAVASEGDAAVAVRAEGGRNTFVNSGTVATIGSGSHGVAASGGANTVDNSGSIVTTGRGADAVRVGGGGNVIMNSGLIATSGSGAVAVRASGGDNRIVNTGLIETSGDRSHGIRVSGGGNAVMNRGRIHVTGAGADGIRVTAAGSTVTISGWVVSERGNSVSLVGEDSGLHLLAGARLQGSIFFGDPGSGVLRLDPGLNAWLEVRGAPGVVESGGMPMVVYGDLVASVDVTGFAAPGKASNDLTGAIAHALDGRMALGRVGARSQRRDGDGAQGGAGWATLVGGFRDQAATGAATAYTSVLGGVVGGVDRSLGADRVLSLYGGYAQGSFRTDSGGSAADAESFFAGAHASRDRGSGRFVDYGSVVGVTFHESDRLVANTHASGGVDTARAEYNGYFVSPSLTLGRRTRMGGGEVAPSLRFRYSGLFLEDYAEAGSDAGLKVGRRAAQFGEIRGQLAFVVAPSPTGKGAMATIPRVGVEGVFNFSGDVDATFSAIGRRLRFGPGDQDVARVFLGADLIYGSSRGDMSVTAGFEAGFDTDKAFSASVHVGLTR